MKATEAKLPRTVKQISADILAIEKEAEGLLDGLLKVEAKP